MRAVVTRKLPGLAVFLLLLLACNVSFPDSDDSTTTTVLPTVDVGDETEPAGPTPAAQPELASASSLISHIVTPSDTDDAIDPLAPDHLAFLNPAANQRHQLLVFLPGTNARPDLYSLYLQTAANLGYHVVGLSYSNKETVASLCRSSPDLGCHEAARAEIITGSDTTPLLSINRADSIENRLVKLLQYLAAQYTDEDWRQYLQDEEPDWGKIAFSGHSQGGGHAGLLASWHQLARVVFINSPSDYNANSQVVASWIRADNATPADGYYAFFHNQDGGERRLTIYQRFGMDVLGPATNSDVVEPPFNGSHIIFTDSPTPLPHSSIIGDPLLSLDEAGRPEVQPVWIYILTHNAAE